MTRTVQLHRPINAQIGPVDNQLIRFENFVIVLIKGLIAAARATGSPGSMLAVRIDSNLRQCMRIYEICSKCDIFEKYK